MITHPSASEETLANLGKTGKGGGDIDIILPVETPITNIRQFHLYNLNKAVSQMWVACHKPVKSQNKAAKGVICFEHKT